MDMKMKFNHVINKETNRVEKTICAIYRHEGKVDDYAFGIAYCSKKEKHSKQEAKKEGRVRSAKRAAEALLLRQGAFDKFKLRIVSSYGIGKERFVQLSPVKEFENLKIEKSTKILIDDVEIKPSTWWNKTPPDGIAPGTLCEIKPSTWRNREPLEHKTAELPVGATQGGWVDEEVISDGGALTHLKGTLDGVSLEK